LFIKKQALIYIGLSLLLISVIWLICTTFINEDLLFALSFGSAIPFLMYAGRVIYLLFKQKKAQTIIN
jgi:hypothetical protein